MSNNNHNPAVPERDGMGTTVAVGPRPLTKLLEQQVTQISRPPSNGQPRCSPSTWSPSSAKPTHEDETCPTCGGLGWLRLDVPFGHPQFGQLVPCDDCGQVHRQRIARFDRYSSRKGRALKQRFHNFDLNGPAAAATEAYNAALAFTAEPVGWLVIHGPKGNGKSHLAAAVANYLIDERGMAALFLTVPDLLRSLRQEIRDSVQGQGGDSRMLDTAQESPVLILDDLGAERWTEWAEEQLFLLLDYRYRLESPTVVITNEELERLPSRIYSRLGDRALSRVVHNPAPDYRWGDGRVTR
jgi:DNA replication protein DnaC